MKKAAPLALLLAASCGHSGLVPSVPQPAAAGIRPATNGCTFSRERLPKLDHPEFFAIAASSDYYSSSSSSYYHVPSYIVGGYAKGSKALALAYMGRKWVLQMVPNVSSTFNYLYSVAVVSRKDVWAVGQYTDDKTHRAQALIEHFNGDKWAVVPSPMSKYGAYLYSVRIVAPDEIYAAGAGFIDTMGHYRGLLEEWNGKRWFIVKNNLSAQIGSNYAFVDAPFPVIGDKGVSAAAINAYVNQSTRGALAVWRSGGSNRFALDYVNVPSGETNTTIAGIVPWGTTGNLLVAANASGKSTNSFEPLVEIWNGRKWTVKVAPKIGVGSYFSGVAYSSKVGGLVVGAYDDTPTHSFARALSFNGTMLRDLNVPKQSGSYVGVTRIANTNAYRLIGNSGSNGTTVSEPYVNLAKCTPF